MFSLKDTRRSLVANPVNDQELINLSKVKDKNEFCWKYQGKP